MLALLPVLLLTLAAAPADRDSLARARTAYNEGLYDVAIEAATAARAVPSLSSPASLVLARAHLERYRLTTDAADMSSAREALAAVRPEQLDPRQRLELVIGLGQSLYLDDQFGPASELFESALEHGAVLERRARERLLDWWGTSMDRLAQMRNAPDQDALYRRITARMETALTGDPLSAVASYWLVASARAAGDLDRAWDAAIAGWVRAPFSPDGGQTLRGDLDRLVVQALIPERARHLASAGDATQASSMLKEEWEQIKQKWPDASPSLPSSSSLYPSPQ